MTIYWLRKPHCKEAKAVPVHPMFTMPGRRQTPLWVWVCRHG